MSVVVEIERLTKQYRTRGGSSKEAGKESRPALADVSLAIREGEIFALLGPNGAGKTTLIGCVTGLCVPTSGTARVMGRDVQRDYSFTRRVVGVVPQEINFDPFFTVEECLRFQAGYFGVKLAKARLEELLGALRLEDKRHERTRTLSGGMKRRLLIGKALAHEPRVLFLDEPTAGVDVELRRDLWRYVRILRDRGTTIVLTTHYLEEAEELADRVALLHKGRLLLVEEKEALLKSFGQRTLRLILAQPIHELPDALKLRGARLSDQGRVLEVTQPAGEELGPVLGTMLACGLAVRDVETCRTGLEDIYVQLLHQDHPGARIGT
ncbi:MAG: ABC transporter ATP-binding protein [Deltaproteobacteria bacterium]|nr:ABC transporter ATP-binding protein [Deltaproteobacteria bacterium]